MAPANFMPSGRNEVVVLVHDYQDRCPCGILNGPRLSAPVTFRGLTQLLMTMEDLMDQSNDPQRGEEPRSFQHSEQPLRPAGPVSNKPLAVFRINVLFRQNASWQGTLVWMDRKMDAQFRSVLELIRLMDSALTADSE